MRYYNNLTTPSGKYCILNELSNREYLVLLKFLQADNYKGFFDCLDSKIKETNEDFEDYNIVDKCYVYLAFCAYSVRSIARVSNKFIGDQEVELVLMLENIEKSYQEKRIKYKVSDNICITFGVPKRFYVDKNNNIVIDYLSNVIDINGRKLSKSDEEKLFSTTSTKLKILMEEKIVENLQETFDIFENVPMNKFEIPLYRYPLIFNIANIYKIGLKSFYDFMYMCLHHVNMDFAAFMDLSFMETDILLKTCIEEKQKENEQLNNNNQIQ